MTRLVAFTAAWVLGIVLSQAALFHPVWFLLTLPLALILHFAWRHRRLGLLSVWALAGLLLGAVRFQLVASPIDAGHVARYNGARHVAITGIVIAEPDRRPQYTHLQVRVEAVGMSDGSRYTVDGDVLVRASPYTEAFYGDRIQATGALETPPVFDTFSYRDYLARQGIHSLMRDAEVVITSSHHASRVWERVLRFKTYALNRLKLILPEPQASLLTGILLGVESGIPDDLNEAFAATGTSHIVAISGFNLTVIAGYLTRLAGRLKEQKAKVLVALAGIWIYTLLVGASAAVVRAAVMSSVATVSKHAERTVHGPTSLAFAAFAMSALNPWVLWDLGFQLSLAATAGLILFTKPLTTCFKRGLEKFLSPDRAEKLLQWFSDALIVTLAAQITTTPIIMAKFGRLSLVTLLTNFLILPVQTFVMSSGALALIGALFSITLGQVLGWLAWVFLTYTIEVVRWTATFSWASIAVGRFALPLLWGYYTLLFGGWAWFSAPKRERRRWWQTLVRRPKWQHAIGLAVLVLIPVGLYTVPDGRLHVTFLDVGRGDAIFIRTPQGRQFLIDGGPDALRTLSWVGRQMPFWDRQLDGVILTSPDEERLTGLVPVLERYRVARVAHAPQMGAGAHYDRWRALLAEREAATVEAWRRGDLWTLGNEIWLRALWPPEGSEGPLVLQLVYGETTFLLAGAATTVVEAALVERDATGLDSSVLLVPGHGARTAATPAFVQAVEPEIAVISADSASAYDGPSETVLARLMDVPVYRTDRHGNVTCVSDGTTVSVRTSRRVR
jgi:competence protein ComEC